MTLPLQQSEEIFRSLNRELWVVTSADTSRRGGLLATWVYHASLDPEKPVILAGLAPNHHTTELVARSGRLAAHLLTSEQSELAWNFARDSGRRRDKLSGISLNTSIDDVPVLADCHSYLVGNVFARLDTGDRTYFWADITASEKHASAAPLCERQFIDWCDTQQKDVLRSDRLGDIELQRDLQQRYRQDIPEWLRFPG